MLLERFLENCDGSQLVRRKAVQVCKIEMRFQVPDPITPLLVKTD